MSLTLHPLCTVSRVAEPRTFELDRNDWVPNNPLLPALLYRGVLVYDGHDGLAADFEAMFASNGWPPQWRDVIFDYHHYHSTAHKALGVACGRGDVIVGGPGRRPIELLAGDVLVLPAGVGRCSPAHSPDFLVVGAYPPGQQWDICREAPSAETLERIATIERPRCDPVAGEDGPLTRLWS